MDLTALFLDGVVVADVSAIYLVAFYITRNNEKTNDMVIGTLSPIITTIISAIILNYAKMILR